MRNRSNKWYGWSPDLLDHRDLILEQVLNVSSLPTSVNLRGMMPDVYDQGNLGSCTANAIAALYEALIGKRLAFMPSRLFIYYNERVIEGTVGFDSGGYLRDGIKTLSSLGICHETTWKYDIAKFAKRPSKTAYKTALTHKTLTYQRVPQTLESIKGILATGLPIVFGMSVYDAFESPEVAESGVLNMPLPEEKMVGGHAVCLVGYEEATRQFIVRNSWGKNWGIAGYFMMPYDYLKLTSDFWTITELEINK